MEFSFGDFDRNDSFSEIAYLTVKLSMHVSQSCLEVLFSGGPIVQ